MNEDTGFVDKTGKAIHVGDSVQVKISSPTVGTVEKRGKKFVIVYPHYYGGNQVENIRKNLCDYIIVLERAH